MFKKFILIIFTLYQPLFASHEAPLIVTAIMIKNEEHSIEDTLEPLVKGGIEDFLVFDTGSTDKTLSILESFFEKYPHVKGVVKQEPFIDFSTSRNRALELAKEAFPKAQFLFMPDAEWILHNIPALLDFCQNEVDNKTNIHSYLMRVHFGPVDYYSARLFKVDGPAHFVGKVHEVIMPVTLAKTPPDIYLEQRYYERGYAHTKERWKRDRGLLEQAFLENPEDPRSLFYLAETCSWLGDLEAAYKYYKLRTALPGWNEENYLSYYRLADTCEKLSLPAEALYYYMEAFNKRPIRAEPLIRVADLYLREKKYSLAFLFSLQACSLAYPENDLLFVEKELYDYSRYDILSQCAWYVDQKEIGLKALKLALKAYPEKEHLISNLALYTK